MSSFEFCFIYLNVSFFAGRRRERRDAERGARAGAADEGRASRRSGSQAAPRWLRGERGPGAAGSSRQGIHHPGPNQLILINCQQ